MPHSKATPNSSIKGSEVLKRGIGGGKCRRCIPVGQKWLSRSYQKLETQEHGW